MIPVEAVEAAKSVLQTHGRGSDLSFRDVRLALEAAAPHFLRAFQDSLIAHLEEYGGDYDLQYSASIRNLASDLGHDATIGIRR